MNYEELLRQYDDDQRVYISVEVVEENGIFVHYLERKNIKNITLNGKIALNSECEIEFLDGFKQNVLIDYFVVKQATEKTHDAWAPKLLEQIEPIILKLYANQT